jgi:N-acetylornithine carbamoyltransferase
MTLAELKGRDLLSTLDYSTEEVRQLVDLALDLKHGRKQADLRGLACVLLFFNPSVRTRVSCESAMARYGGTAIAIHPGKDTWHFECREGAVMDAETQEHVRELAPVLSRMCHFIGVRKSELIGGGTATASAPQGYAELAADEFIRRLREFAEVPVINLESNRFHPMQGLADSATLVERLRNPAAKNYVLTWAWHPKSLPVATPHSQVLSAANLGMNVTVLRPPGYGLDREIMSVAAERAESLGGSVRETDDVESAYSGAHVVCAKAWASLDYYGRFEEETRAKRVLRAGWMVDEDKLALTDDAFFMHCLPVRRNVVVSDAVLNSNRSAVIDEAENRLWTAAAVFAALGGNGVP